MKTQRFSSIFDVDNFDFTIKIRENTTIPTYFRCWQFNLTRKIRENTTVLLYFDIDNFVFKTKSVKTQRFDRILMLTIQFHGKNPWKRNNTVVLCCWQFWFHEKKLRSIFAVNLNCFDCWKMSYSKAFPDWIFSCRMVFWLKLKVFDSFW